MPIPPHRAAALRKVVRAFNILAATLQMTLLPHLAGEADVKKMRARLLKKLHQDKTKAAAGAPTSPEWTALQTAWET